MVRPNFSVSEINSIDLQNSEMSGIEDDILQNDNFASWNEYGTESTPRDN